MKESYRENLAGSSGPEPYAGGGGTVGVAWGQGDAGQPLNSRSPIPCADLVLTGGRQHHRNRMAKVLGNIYEEDFLGFSCGFRAGRSQHDALDALSVAITSKRVRWILVGQRGSGGGGIMISSRNKPSR
jgi:hypothetical protein